MKLQSGYSENVGEFDNALGVGKSFDLIKKELSVAGKEFTFYYLDGFVGGALNKLMIHLTSVKEIAKPDLSRGEDAVTAFAKHHLPFVETDVVFEAEIALRAVLSGATLLLGEPFGAAAVVIDSRSYPARTVGEPENDRVLIGARDGFVETLIFNTALIRRRIRDPKLRVQYLNLGSQSKTDVALCFLEDVADTSYVSKLKKELERLRPEALSMGQESLAELLIRKRWYNPLPKIRYTERPDVAAAQLSEGSVVILCDNSPEAMILPSSIFDFMQETNDFYFPPLTGTYIRFVRYLVFLATLFLIPLWFLLTKNPDSAPPFLTFLLPQTTGRIPIFLQLLLVEFLVDGLRMACMNTPDMLSNSLSVVGGLILGDFAVNVGWLIPEVILCMAFVSIANFSPRSYQLGYAFKFLRIGLLILIQCFDFVGFWTGFAGILLLLCTNRSIPGNRPYLYPLIPFDGKALRSFFIRRRKRK